MGGGDHVGLFDLFRKPLTPWVAGRSEWGGVEHRLELPQPVDLDAAYAELWRRVLEDGLAARFDWRAIAFEFICKERPEAPDGRLTARFLDASESSFGQPEYALAFEAFTVLDEDVEEDEHERDLIRFCRAQFDRVRAV